VLEKLNLLNGTQTPCSPDVHNKIKEVAEEDELSDSFKTDSDFAASSEQQNRMAIPLPVQLQLPKKIASTSTYIGQD
jgi:hypothetical protein